MKHRISTTVRMATVESAAAFRYRAVNDIKLSSGIVDLIAAGGFDTFSRFTFIVPYSQNGPDDAALTAAVTALLIRPPTAVELTKFRRLQFESQAMMLAEAKHLVERPDDAAPRKVPAPERNTRHQQQAARLVGVAIAGVNEPSHAVLDLVQQQVEEGVVKWISLEKCTCRTQELQGVKVTPDVTRDKRGFLRIENVSESGDIADTSSDMKLRQAFLRRALAYDQSSLISFDVSEAWADAIFAAAQRQAPLGFTSPSLSRGLDADRMMFVLLGEECRAGIAPLPNGDRPLEIKMLQLLHDARIAFMLLPTMVSHGHHNQPAVRDGRHDSGQKAHVSINSRQIQRRQDFLALKSHGNGKAGKSGSGRGKGGKGVKNDDSMPDSIKSYFAAGGRLAGCWYKVNRQRVCAKFNLGICPAKIADGSKCSHGMHLCCTKQCGGKHAYSECTQRGRQFNDVAKNCVADTTIDSSQIRPLQGYASDALDAREQCDIAHPESPGSAVPAPITVQPGIDINLPVAGPRLPMRTGHQSLWPSGRTMLIRSPWWTDRPG